MLHQTDGLSLQSPIRPLSVLVFHLLLTHSCRGQSQLIGPPQSIVALVGDDIILPCHLKPEKDVTAEPLEWKRSDLNPQLVHVMRSGRNLETAKNPSYRGRTSLFTEELKRGNISLKLSNVQLSDQGTYKCDIPLWNKHSSVKLVVGAVSSAVITLSGMDRDKGGVMLDCESRGWYPEPEVLWLDGEGNLLSAGPTETVTGPDDLYTVSSRVTVEKRHSNSFTCRVQQRNINQTRETHITVPGDFFSVSSGSSSSSCASTIIGLVVGFMFILAVAFVVWKWRQNKIKNKEHHGDEETQGGGETGPLCQNEEETHQEKAGGETNHVLTLRKMDRTEGETGKDLDDTEAKQPEQSHNSRDGENNMTSIKDNTTLTDKPPAGRKKDVENAEEEKDTENIGLSSEIDGEKNIKQPEKQDGEKDMTSTNDDIRETDKSSAEKKSEEEEKTETEEETEKTGLPRETDGETNEDAQNKTERKKETENQKEKQKVIKKTKKKRSKRSDRNQNAGGEEEHHPNKGGDDDKYSSGNPDVTKGATDQQQRTEDEEKEDV